MDGDSDGLVSVLTDINNLPGGASRAATEEESKLWVCAAHISPELQTGVEGMVSLQLRKFCSISTSVTSSSSC